MNPQDPTTSREPGRVPRQADVLRDINPVPFPRERARQWALVLSSRGIPHQVRGSGGGWWISVPTSVESRARQEVSRFERENYGWPPRYPATQYPGPSLLPVFSVLLLLATFHNLTGIDSGVLGIPDFDWVEAGNAYAGKIRHGEWWRTITALTLHADYLHLASNLAMAAILLPRLCRAFGSGRAWFLVLLSGLLGNWLNAFFQPYHHQAIGFSTAVFGAVGLFSGTGFRRRLPYLKRSLLPLFAGLALLAWVGSGGERTDLGGHLLGFLAGLVLGLLVPVRPLVSAGKGRFPIFALVAAALPILAWVFAFRFFR